MKKFTALMLVAICLVVGGVYASWTYATGNMADTVAKTVNPTIDAVTGNTPVGKLTVVDQGEDELEINITDDYDGATKVDEGKPGDYVAEVNYTGALVVKFEASENASAEIYANGLKLKVTVTVNAITYDGKAIFAAKDLELTTENYGEYTGSNGTFTWTIDAEDLKAALTFNGGVELKLATLAEYNAFADELEKVQITLTVAQAGTTPVENTPAQNG
jgi:hypothetical protein